MATINYLRISVTDRCNFQCQYCMPEAGTIAHLPPDWLTRDELQQLLSQVFIPLGFSRFRLTGGEPLLRPDIGEITADLAQLEGVEDLAMSTNGFLLAAKAEALWRAGLRRLNISLDSLDPLVFQQLTGGRDRWRQVWQGIQVAHDLGFAPLKLNVVVIPGVNDQEVLDLAALSRDLPWHIRFIEFMPIGNAQLFADRGWIDSAQLRQQIRQHWGLEPGQVQGNGPADVFQIPGALGTVGFISQMSECFCDRCNRLRLSADGWLRPCLLNQTGQIDLKTPLRQGQSLCWLRQQVADLLQIKPEINYKMRQAGTTGAYDRTMAQIGG
ncbi:MAG: GTP 3',8-cyclase MoaA [Nodosilinea sp. LVE1205-7]|jgi:cyclic pyranopterin phosphate synthase